MTDKLKVVVDFDNTIAKYSGDIKVIGEPIKKVIDLLKRLFEEGHIIVVYSGRPTSEIVGWLNDQNIKVHKVNELLLIPFEDSVTPSGKMAYDVYIDDKAINPLDSEDLYKKVIEIGKRVAEKRTIEEAVKLFLKGFK